MKMMACLIDDDDCLVRCVCPVCGTVHGAWTETWDYFDYIENGPVVGRYEGWDDAHDICCPACDAAAETMFGQDYIRALYEDGELDAVAELCMLARKCHGAAVGRE